VLFPIYGYYKLPPCNHFPGTQRLPDKKKQKSQILEWSNGLARDPLMRGALLGQRAREFPL